MVYRRKGGDEVRGDEGFGFLIGGGDGRLERGGSRWIRITTSMLGTLICEFLK